MVVLKVPKWDRGTVLMCEAPLVMACGYERPMAALQRQEEEENTASNDELAKVAESARVKRWLQATSKLKWKPEEILFYEILLYCRDHQPGKQTRKMNDAKLVVCGPKVAPEAPAPVIVDEPLESKFIRHAEWLFRNRKFDSCFDEKKSPRENMLQVLADTALTNDTFFSRREKGCGWYPLIGQVRQASVTSTEINACIWFQNSVAYLVALTDLKLGDEIVIGDNRENIGMLKNTNPIAESELMGLQQALQAGPEMMWQRLTKTVAEYGKPFLDRYHQTSKTEQEYVKFLTGLRDDSMSYLRTQWLSVEHKHLYGKIPDLVRLEFFLIFLQQLLKLTQPNTRPVSAPPPPAATTTTTTTSDKQKDPQKKMDVPELEDFLTSMGVRKELQKAPAIKEADEQLTPDEWQLYQQIVVLGNRRVMMYDLLPLLQNDPSALAYQQLWHNPKINLANDSTPIIPNIPLIKQWNTIADKLAKKHPSFDEKE